MKNRINIADYFRYTARYMLLALLSLIFIFALVSGSHLNNAGWMGIIYNSPNAIPWAIMLLILALAWRKELAGGIAFIILGIFTVYFFQTYQDIVVFIIFSFPLIAFGGFFIGSWYLRRQK